MKPEKPTQQDANEGEGNRTSARHYNQHLHDFVAGGKVEPAAQEAKAYVRRQPEDAARAEREARRGPHSTRVTLDEMVAKSRTVVDDVRSLMEHAAGRLRARFGRK